MTDLNPLNWNWQQLQAAGKHAASYVAGGVTVAVAWHFISPTDGTAITDNVNLLVEGLTKTATAIAGLLGVLVPIYTALRAAHNASPASQVTSVVNNLSAPEITQAANAVADPASRDKLIAAVADMPEVKKIVPVNPDKAVEIPSDKVVKS